MRKALIITIAAAASTIALSSAADARDGCGRGWHMTRYGNCRPNPHYWRNRDYYWYSQPPVYGYQPRYYPAPGYWGGEPYYRYHRDHDDDYDD